MTNTTRNRRIALTAVWAAIGALVFFVFPYKAPVRGKTTPPAQIDLQPFSDVPHQRVTDIYNALKNKDSNIHLLAPLPLPANAWYAPRNRYRADSLLAWLSKRATEGRTIIAITTSDVSSTKGTHADWGVIGLGYTPGNACIVSSYRLSKSNTTAQWIKICLHELGHTRGLPHCKVANCYMRDAEGHNVADELTGFCADCAAYLGSKPGLLFTGI